MAISTNWIRDYVDLDGVDLTDLADKITKAGVNVEGIKIAKIDNIVIGYVEKCTKHPDSDHLNICQVNLGSITNQIVCGASNVREGIKVMVALEGAILPGGFEIKKTTIRGIESNGMICALFELGLEEKTDENYKKGIYVLNEDALIGIDAFKYLGLDDTIYELDLNPNRNIDCTNHIGFSYEVAAVLNKNVKLPSLEIKEINDNIKNHFELEIDTPNCSLYNAKMVRNVKIKESPEFIKNRLISAGMRPINNVVDISNYVMLEFGQPLHFFDKDKLGNKIKVRMAQDKEEVVTLDKKARILTSEDIVITDGVKPVCIAGVMGAENTEVDNNTKNILIESAIFNPYNIRYTSINLDLRSEASLRYERGLNYEYTQMALNRACHLLEKYADGEVLSGTITIDHTVKKVKEASVSLEDVNALLGMELTCADIEDSLTRLGFVYKKNGNSFDCIIPNRRLDVEANKADLIEEIGRLYGYEKIESKLPLGLTKSGNYIGNIYTRKLISKRLRSLSLNEVRTYTLISENDDKLFNYNRGNAIELNKPISTDKKIIRQSILPSILKVIDYNKARNVKDMMLYEISNTYSNEMDEETKVSIVLKGDYLSNNWNGLKIKVDFYLLKGIIENILDYLGLKNRYSFEVKELNDMHPGMSAEIFVDRESIGFMGRIHPSLRKEEIFVAEFSLTKLIDKKIKPIKHKEASKYPEINKDVAFVVNKEITANQLINQIQKSGGRLLTNIEVFDVYTGENILENQTSLAFSLTFSDLNKTLTEEEVMILLNKIINEVEDKMGAKLRDK